MHTLSLCPHSLRGNLHYSLCVFMNQPSLLFNQFLLSGKFSTVPTKTHIKQTSWVRSDWFHVGFLTLRKRKMSKGGLSWMVLVYANSLSNISRTLSKARDNVNWTWSSDVNAVSLKCFVSLWLSLLHPGGLYRTILVTLFMWHAEKMRGINREQLHHPPVSSLSKMSISRLNPCIGSRCYQL